jgi:hypothetical protein
LAVAAAPAAATQQNVVSQPDGDFALEAIVRSETDKDRDGNRDTATNADRLFAHVDVCRRFDKPQVVQLDITVDRPGTEFDEQFTQTADLATFSCVGRAVRDKVIKKWGVGDYYTLTARASNGSDTATASASVTVN